MILRTSSSDNGGPWVEFKNLEKLSKLILVVEPKTPTLEALLIAGDATWVACAPKTVLRLWWPLNPSILSEDRRLTLDALLMKGLFPPPPVLLAMEVLLPQETSGGCTAFIE